MSSRDQQFLDHAIRVASRGLGRTGLNPCVGCVIVKDGQVIAVARSADGGRPHAETQTLALAGDRARGATAYVSLEPCAHHGKTPPCTEALIAAGVARVVIAAIDPDPRVSGRGITLLRDAGIEVFEMPTPSAVIGLRGFFRRVHHRLPEVTLKLATSLDARMTDFAGRSQWITGEKARAHGHAFRARHDAILTGIGTVLADDPQLTVRLPGVSHPHLIRVVADRQLQLPLTSKLVKSAGTQPVWVVTTTRAIEENASHATELREAGVVIHAVEDETLAPLTLLKTLGEAGVMRLMVEAGPTLTTAFLTAQAVDRLVWYRAPMLLGNTGQAAVGGLEVALDTATRARLAAQYTLGADRADVYELESCLPD